MITSKSKKIKSQSDEVFILRGKTKEAKDVLTLKFLPVNGRLFSFEPGQFILVSFLDSRANNRIRAYSISSCPQDKFLSITVKKVGVFSSALHKLKIGEKVKISSARGDFYPEKSMIRQPAELVFLAAGIGIAPFYAIIKDFYRQKSPNKITLFYSNRTKKEIVFFKELNKIAKNWLNLKIIYLVTREEMKDKCISECCRVDIIILKKYLKDLKGKHYFICGPREFVSDKFKELKDCGVKGRFVKIEAF